MKLTFLGTGTSTGIPAIGCNCATCRSTDPSDRRLRTSALLTSDEGKSILIDCGPDFREQILQAGSPNIDAVLLTHIHFDHVGGIEDLRPYCYRPDGNHGLPIFCEEVVNDELHRRLPYCFATDHYPGAPIFKMNILSVGTEAAVAGVNVLPLRIMHAPDNPITGFRIGKLAFITDCKIMPEATIQALRSVDTLVINALRHEPHPTHMSLNETLSIIERIKPRRAYLIHLCHDMGMHAQVSTTLPEGVEIAVDGLTINI